MSEKPEFVTHAAGSAEAAATSDRQELLDRLAQQSRLFDATLSAISDFAYSFDRAGRFTYVNKALLDLWGIGLEEALGKDFFDLRYPDALAAKLQRQIQQVFDTGRGLSDETPYTSPTGKGGYYEYIFAPVFASDGTVEAVAGSTRDITARKGTEQSLLEANERSELSLLAGETGTWVIDIESRTVYPDQNVRRIFCLPPGNHLGAEDLDRLLSAIPAQDRQLVQAEMLRALADAEHVYHVEHRVLQDDGSVKWIIARGKVDDGSGKPPRLRGVVLDVTERKQIEFERERLLKQVQVERERLVEAFERSPSFLAVLRGPDHVFELANERYYQLIGRRDLIGKPLRRAVPEVEGQGFFEILDRVYATGEPFVGTGMSIKLRRQSDGPLEELYIDFVYQAMRGHNDSIIGVMAHGVDVTERTRAEGALVQSQQRLHTLFEHMQDAIMLADDDAAYVEANAAACEMTGYSREELLRLSVWDITPIPDRALGERLWRDFIKQGRQGGEYTLTRKDGSTVEVEYRAVAQLLPGLHLSVLRDVTERKRTEEELRHSHEALAAANKAKDQFLAVLSHELRTPLSPVVMTLAAMEAHPQLPVELRDDVAMIRRNIDLETKLIDDLLDLSRVTSGKLQLHLQPTRLHELLRHTLEVCASDIHARRIRIDQQFDATTDLVIADSARLGQVFWNLLKNAVKFSESGGTIVVRTSGIAGDGRAAPPGVRAEIIDNGVGIPANVLPRVFDAFEQGDVRTTRQFGGLGLGLAISKAVVDMHGGRIRATSAGPGMGATFTVELNAASGALADKDARQSSPQDSRPVARARILLVEDHADTARILARLLHHAGYEAHAVHNIAAALDAAAKQPFDLLISDIGLPDGNGFDLMAQIKSRHGISGIALTGYGMEDDMRRGREAGFVDHVVKPVSIPQLEQVIQRVLQDEQRVR